MASKRMLQVGEQIREHVALMLARGELSDPRLHGITIQSCKVSPDLQIARLYYSLYDDSPSRRAESGRGLKQAAGFIRRSLGVALKMRYTPEVTFFYDDTSEKVTHVFELINKAKAEDLAAAQDRGDAPASPGPSRAPDGDADLSPVERAE